MHHPTDSRLHNTVCVTPHGKHWLERQIAKWVPHYGSIRRLAALLYHWATSPFGSCFPLISGGYLFIYFFIILFFSIS